MKHLKRFESPDGILFKGDGYEKKLNWMDQDAIPFGYYYDDKFYIGEPGQAHGDMTRNIDGNPFGRDYMKFPGRIWLGEQIISFWVMPNLKEFKEIIRSLESHLDISMQPDDIYGEWKVEVGGDFINMSEYDDYYEDTKHQDIRKPHATYEMIQKFENYLILEIGDARVPGYEIDNHIKNFIGDNYFFTTDSGLRYCINIMTDMSGGRIEEKDVENCEIVDDVEDFYDEVIAISFFTFTGDDENYLNNYDDKVITNRGEMFRIMSTLKDVLTKYLKENPHIKYILVGGQRGEKEIDKEQRDRLYLAYFKKIKPEWESGKIYCEMMQEWYYLIKTN